MIVPDALTTTQASIMRRLNELKPEPPVANPLEPWQNEVLAKIKERQNNTKPEPPKA